MLQAEQVLQDRYQLQRQLGRTAAGRQTWLAIDLQFVESVTLKLLAFAPQMQWEELKLFERNSCEIERETLGFKYGRKKINFGAILGVFLHKQGRAYQVNIRSYYHNYQLGGALGENESAWLTQEIQDWLNSR